MRDTIIIIAGVVVIAAAGFFCYTIQQAQIRQKELDKKTSDNLQQQKEINELIKQKLEANELTLTGYKPKKKASKKNEAA